MTCKEKEKFASYQINRLIKSDFGQKLQKFGVFTPTSPSGPPLEAVCLIISITRPTSPNSS